MSLIGSLEKVNLPDILRRVEVYGKTGLLKVHQGEQRVELYYHQGQLICIGPVQTNITLGDRLLQDRVISQEALQEVTSAIELSHPSETRMALTLIDFGHVNREDLRAWATKEASKVIRVLLTWAKGEIYFEDGVQPAAERLLISVPVTSLLPSSLPASVSQPVGAGTISAQGQAPAGSNPASARHAHVPTRFDAAQIVTKADATAMVGSTSSWSNAPVSDSERNTDVLALSAGSLTPPRRVTASVPQKRIDTAFMQPQMVLVPTDLSGWRERNPQVPLTPEQWRLFTRADGQTSLQTMCQGLGMPREQVCQLAGELITLGLVTIAMPTSGPLNELSPLSRDFIDAGPGNGNSGSGRAGSVAQPWLPGMPMEEINKSSSPAPVETQSQWGNGGNGATFLLGGGWVLAPSPSQPSQASGPLQLRNQVYAPVGDPR